MAGDRWITLVTVSGFTNINVGGVFIIPSDKGELVN
jgi:hypothetical protein